MEERTLLAKAGRALFGDTWKSELANAWKVRKDFVGQIARGVREAREGHWTELLALLRDRARGLKARAEQLDKVADEVTTFITTQREHNHERHEQDDGDASHRR